MNDEVKTEAAPQETVAYQDPSLTDEQKKELAEYKAKLVEKFGDNGEKPVAL